MRQTEGERNTVTWMSTVAKARAFKLGKDERPQSLLTHCRRETLSPLAPTLEHHHRPATPQRRRTANHNNRSGKATSNPPPLTSSMKHTTASANYSKHIHSPLPTQGGDFKGALPLASRTWPGFSPGIMGRLTWRKEGIERPLKRETQSRSHRRCRGQREVG